MLTQKFQDAKLLAHGSGSYGSGIAIDDIDLCVVRDLGRHALRSGRRAHLEHLDLVDALSGPTALFVANMGQRSNHSLEEIISRLPLASSPVATSFLLLKRDRHCRSRDLPVW